MPSVRARCSPILAVIFAAACADAAASQDARAAWDAAGRTVGGWSDRLDRFPRTLRWLDGGRALWFATGDGAARRYVRIDCATGERSEAETAAGIGVDGAPVRLEPQPARTRSRQRAGERVEVTFVNELGLELVLLWVEPDGNAREYARLAPGGRSVQSTFDGHAWRLQTIAGETVAAFRAGADAALAIVDAAAREALGGGRGRDRDRRDAGGVERAAPAVFVRDGGLWRRDGDGARELAPGGATSFRRDLHPSPDGAAVLAFDETAVAERQVTLVESSPRDAVQPRTTTIGYRKPGDPLPAVRPRLFRIADGVEVPVDPAPFADAWSVDRAHWAADGREVFVLYNRRGHQQLTVYGIDATTGAVRAVVDERSATFVDYSQKTWMHWLDDTGELLWASERSGFNHLYRIDVATGAATAITDGSWMVRSVERVDAERREVWFTALGIHPGQDPYHRHLARVRLDGSELRVLTAADGDHDWEFAPDGAHFVARWSRIDQPTVSELRRSADGALVAELGRDDATRLLAAGFRPTERFVAKGRDGLTDIHGVLILPSSFDPSRRYPVLESIYAGPHDFHVPKSFTLSLRERRFAELGFVVVQIDGMGTNWRGKAFHDVCWRNLKDAGFPDRIAWMRAAAADRPWLDLSRVGVFGGSAGGQNAMAALLWHGDFYKAAAADCGCHDNRMDKIWWNEAWMGWPLGDHYAANSNVEHARRLQGDLFLTVGELDRNVDPASTLQVVDALIRADKDFEFLLVPGGGHGVGEAPYPARRRAEFFMRALRP